VGDERRLLRLPRDHGLDNAVGVATHRLSHTIDDDGTGLTHERLAEQREQLHPQLQGLALEDETVRSAARATRGIVAARWNEQLIAGLEYQRVLALPLEAGVPRVIPDRREAAKPVLVGDPRQVLAALDRVDVAGHLRLRSRQP